MMIDQQVSSPITPSTTGNSIAVLPEPVFRNAAHVQDGDTVAIGGFIQETYSQVSSGVPFLHRIPILGAAFGSKSISKARTELIVFLTEPRVIYDTNQITGPPPTRSRAASSTSRSSTGSSRGQARLARAQPASINSRSCVRRAPRRRVPCALASLNQDRRRPRDSWSSGSPAAHFSARGLDQPLGLLAAQTGSVRSART